VHLQELDKLRRQRADEFRDKRYDMLEKFTELLIMQVCLDATMTAVKHFLTVPPGARAEDSMLY